MKNTPYICTRNPARVRYTEAQASERGLYLNLKLWNRKKLLFMSMALHLITPLHIRATQSEFIRTGRQMRQHDLAGALQGSFYTVNASR